MQIKRGLRKLMAVDEPTPEFIGCLDGSSAKAHLLGMVIGMDYLMFQAEKKKINAVIRAIEIIGEVTKWSTCIRDFLLTGSDTISFAF